MVKLKDILKDIKIHEDELKGYGVDPVILTVMRENLKMKYKKIKRLIRVPL